MQYEFEYRGKNYEEKTMWCTIETKNRFEWGKRSIRLVFDPDNPYTNAPLENEKDINYFNVTDSEILDLNCN